ncbi:MAG: prefoldin subunit [Candidatus Aenigmarchaeota archaeon]|nr:prefoldin subunit [Candidatus Aenigmarchaeota archaeon]
MAEIPPQAQQMIVALQNAQQQLQAFAMQKQAFVLQRHETERAIDELERTGEKDDVYRVSGPIMIRSTKQKLLEDLKARIEKMDASVKRITEMEKKTAERAQETQVKLERLFSQPQAKGAAG